MTEPRETITVVRFLNGYAVYRGDRRTAHVGYPHGPELSEVLAAVGFRYDCLRLDHGEPVPFVPETLDELRSWLARRKADKRKADIEWHKAEAARLEAEERAEKGGGHGD